MAEQEQFLSGQEFGEPNTKEMPQQPVAASKNPYEMFAPGESEETDMGDVNVAAEDLITRAVLWMTDENKPQGAKMAPREAFLNRVNVRGVSAPEAVGGAVGMAFSTLTEAAKRQGVEYPPESILMAVFPVLEEATDLVRMAGIFPELPEAGPEDDVEFGPADEADGDPMEGEAQLTEYQAFITSAAIEAATTMGEYLISTGQVDQAEWQGMLNEMMEEEAINGELDDWDPLSQVGPGQFMSMMDAGMGAPNKNTPPQPPPGAPPQVARPPQGAPQ